MVSFPCNRGKTRCLRGSARSARTGVAILVLADVIRKFSAWRPFLREMMGGCRHLRVPTLELNLSDKDDNVHTLSDIEQTQNSPQ